MPITIDGQGSELVGSDPLAPEGWEFDEQIKRYFRTDVRPRLFLIVDGQMVYATEATPEALQPGQWCEQDGTLFYHPPEDTAIDQLMMEACVRINGVQIRGDTAYMVIKNFNARHFANDGYNIHGEARALEFYNCNARDMGDEGFSSHGSAETLLDGGIYINCDSGVFNVNTGGTSITRNIVVRSPRRMGFGVTPRDGSVEHTLENAILIDCPIGLNVGKKTKVSNVIIISTGSEPATAISMQHGGVLRQVAVTGEALRPLRVRDGGFFELSEVVFNAVNPLQIRTNKPLAEVIRFDHCAVAAGMGIIGGGGPSAAFDAISGTGQGNREFESLANIAFLRWLLDEGVPGPSPELLEMAIKQLQ